MRAGSATHAPSPPPLAPYAPVSSTPTRSTVPNLANQRCSSTYPPGVVANGATPNTPPFVSTAPQHEHPRACLLRPSPGACSLRWSSPSLLSQTVKGWHARPGKETVTSTLLEQRTRSPSGTGRAQFRTHANDQRSSDPNVPVTTNTTVDPPILTGSYGAAERCATMSTAMSSGGALSP